MLYEAYLINESWFISFEKYFACLPESHFSIEFPVTFTFVPDDVDTTTVIADNAQTTTADEPTENLQEQPIVCVSGKKQITAFKCGPCPDGYNCEYPNSPTICEVEGSMNDILTRDKSFRTNKFVDLSFRRKIRWWNIDFLSEMWNRDRVQLEAFNLIVYWL